MRVPAVVGSFPEPFLSGQRGQASCPIRLVCVGRGPAPCDEVETRLRDAGVAQRRAARTSAVLGRRGAAGPRRPVDGRPRATSPRASSRRARRSPACSRGRRAAGDRDRRCSTRDGESERTLGAGRRPASPPRATEDQQPTWVVTGTDDAGVAAAAAALTEDELARPLRGRDRRRAATVPLPVSVRDGPRDLRAARRARCTRRARASARRGAWRSGASRSSVEHPLVLGGAAGVAVLAAALAARARAASCARTRGLGRAVRAS